MKYRYEISGTAARDQTWTTAGVSKDVTPGAFRTVFEDAILQTYQMLTEGKAIYGQPGAGCQGPYTFTRLLIEMRNAPKHVPVSSVACPHCHWGFAPSVIEQHIREKHPNEPTAPVPQT